MSDELRTRLNAETAKAAWPELEPHFARGVVVKVDAELDLVEVAATFVENRRETVDEWMKSGKVSNAADADAQRWTAGNANLWAVVVAPWVLVQESETKD